jgi:hypothetical protein
MLTFRLADEQDSEPFSNWIAASTQIPVQDVEDSLKEYNPTSITLVIQDSAGKVILFAPTFAVARLAFIGFNPEASPLERARGLSCILGATQEFWKTHGVTEIDTLTKTDYPIAEWAIRHGFQLENRQILRLIAKPDSGTN